MRVLHFLLSVIYFVFPTAELVITNRHLGLKTKWETRYATAKADVRAELQQRSENMTALAQEVSDSETKRLDTIESKAATYVVAISIVTGLTSFIPQPIDSTPARCLATVGIVSIGYLVFAVVHALKARAIGELALPSTNDVREIPDPKDRSLEPAITLLTRARFNEPRLTWKSNHLAAAEKMFIRGVILVAVTSAFTISLKAWRIEGPGCTVYLQRSTECARSDTSATLRDP